VNRRESLKFAMLAAGLGLVPGFALARGGSTAVIYDGRYREACAFASGGPAAFDCQHDAAGLWYRHFAGRNRTKGNISGLTCAADALVLADCARREGLRFARIELGAGRSSRLIAWEITRKDIP